MFVSRLLRNTALGEFICRRRQQWRLKADFRTIRADDRRRISFYSQFIRPGDTVFDVGANRGNRTKTFLELGAKVVAFEPQDSCAEYLKSVLSNERRFTLVRMALGPHEGKANMMISSTTVLSSLSPAWVAATKASGRFANYEWEESQEVSVTTLDQMIATHGQPSFVKIDVEGFELEVLCGLSRPLPCISIEFTAEYLDNSFQAIDRLASLGPIEGQLSHGETLELALSTWVSAEDLKAAVVNVGPRSVGDIYVRSIEL